MKEQSSVLNNIIGDCIQMNTDIINQYNDSKLPKFIIKLLILRKNRKNKKISRNACYYGKICSIINVYYIYWKNNRKRNTMRYVPVGAIRENMILAKNIYGE